MPSRIAASSKRKRISNRNEKNRTNDKSPKIRQLQDRTNQAMNQDYFASIACRIRWVNKSKIPLALTFPSLISFIPSIFGECVCVWNANHFANYSARFDGKYSFEYELVPQQTATRIFRSDTCQLNWANHKIHVHPMKYRIWLQNLNAILKCMQSIEQLKYISIIIPTQSMMRKNMIWISIIGTYTHASFEVIDKNINYPLLAIKWIYFIQKRSH